MLTLNDYSRTVRSLLDNRSSFPTDRQLETGKQLAALFALSPPPGSLDRHQQGLLDHLASPERGAARSDRALGSGEPLYGKYFQNGIGKAKAIGGTTWAEMMTAHLHTLVALHPLNDPAAGFYGGTIPDEVFAYQKQHEVVTALYRYLLDSRDAATGWLLPVLYQVCKDLRLVATKADQRLVAQGLKAGKLEEASRLLQKCFSCCLNDRSPDPLVSRKMGTYYLATLLYKTYFQLNSTALCRNIIRGITAVDLPPLSSFPTAHRVTYTYYMGVFAFLREDYGEAERLFTQALGETHRKVGRNIDLILDYLIPLLLLRGVLPYVPSYSSSSTSSKPRLKPSLTLFQRPSSASLSLSHRSLFSPFCEAVKRGDVAAYDAHLADPKVERALMRRGTYLVVERAREGAVRGGLKKAWILEGKPARMPIETFRKYYNAAQRVRTPSSAAEGAASKPEEVAADVQAPYELDGEEMECLLANMIHKGLMKGYISHAHQLVVLSKEKPFPWYPPYRSLSESEAKQRAEREKKERERAVATTAVLNAHTPQPTSSSFASTQPQAAGVTLPGSGDLWSSILDSVKGAAGGQMGAAGTAASTGGVGETRQCIVLGGPNSGKSTLLSRMRSSAGELPPSTSVNGSGDEENKHLDLGMSYDVLDVRDEGDEGETLARLSLFHLSDSSPSSFSSSSSASFSAPLLSLALSRSTLLSSLILIVLDWEKPWKWVEELEGWIAVLEERLEGIRLEGQGAGGGKECWEEVEGRERLEAFIRAYHEPPAGSTTITSASTTTAYDPEAPLPPGTLTDNLGLGIVIVCTKADHMNVLEREREFTDEQFDYIQQTLRTVALRYGAALFYTSQTSPPSYSKLRQYILHRLFSSPATITSLSSNLPPPSPSPPSAPVPSRSLPSTTSAITSTASTSSAFPFPNRANVIDRDAVLVPSGWDSWGKIRVLRERFEAEQVGEGWERDLEAVRKSRQGRCREEGGEESGLRKEYEMVIVDFEAEDEPVNLASTVTPLDEQIFLKTHFETLQADAAKDPRLAFRQQPSTSSAGVPSSSASPSLGSGGLGPSVVGPMAGATLELPTVVSTLERARGAEMPEELGRSTRGAGGGEAAARGMSRQNSQTGPASARSPPLDGSSSGVPATSSRHSPSLSASLLQRSSSQTSSHPNSPALPSAGGGTAGTAAGGNQVLADFFQSLLTARGAGGAAAGGAVAGGGAAAGGLSASTNRRQSDQREGK
ncbi:hypothetical protein JCM11251_007388 [Rhodosporidiobolus azoricus]